jgi:hypothetical protein
VLDDLVLAVSAGGLLFQHVPVAGQQRVLLQQGTCSRFILESERLYLRQTGILFISDIIKVLYELIYLPAYSQGIKFTSVSKKNLKNVGLGRH